MIEFGGIYYYIDLKNFERVISVEETSKSETTSTLTTSKDENGKVVSVVEVKTETPKSREINVAKFEIIRELIDVVLSNDEDGDTSLGAERVLSQTQLSFKIAFNTLYEYGIIKEKE